jgi:response regulator RpfG family c-di-GMP phosphodiesterase
MRRITIKYARPGMILELPVYDAWGSLILNRFRDLKEDTIETMKEKGVTELFIRDWKVIDVVVAPLFTPQHEGDLAKAFRQLLLDNAGKPALDQFSISQVHVAVTNMVSDMKLNAIGEINVSCVIGPNDYLYLQPVKTAALSLAIGSAIKMSEPDLVLLGLAAVLKDIGLPPDVIAAVDWLSEGGSPRLRNHPIAGQQLLSSTKLASGKVAQAVLQHHENWSGTGYPQGTKGQDISLFARIISLADAFVDLLTERPGRPRYMSHEAIEYIMANGGDQFDPDLVEVFVRQVPSYPAGLTVRMNDGGAGIISSPKLGFVARPIVRVVYRPGEGELDEPLDIDLSTKEYQTLLITKVMEYD